MKARIILFVLLGIDALILFFVTTDLSISYREAQIVYHADSLLHEIINASLLLLGNHDFALRFPMAVMHLVSVLLLYGISGRYLKKDRDRLWLVAIYMLLPGVNSAALLVDNSGLVMVILLLYVYIRDRFPALEYAILVGALFIDLSFAFLYLGLFFYGVAQRDNRMVIVNMLLFGLAMYIHGFHVGGTPKGHFLDTMGIYAAIFSPIVFVYMFYVLYRRFVTRQYDLLWYVASTALVFSLLLSFRQRIDVQMFAPYLILALPLAAQSFFHSYRVRLKMFRSAYRTVFTISFAVLVINALVVLFNKELYSLLEPGQSHFAYRQHIAKELSEELKRREVTCVKAPTHQMQTRLQFYGITPCADVVLDNSPAAKGEIVTIRYSGTPVYTVYVTKVNR